MEYNKALEIMHEFVKNENLRKHMYAVSEAMSSMLVSLASPPMAEKKNGQWLVCFMILTGRFTLTQKNIPLKALKF